MDEALQDRGEDGLRDSCGFLTYATAELDMVHTQVQWEQDRIKEQVGQYRAGKAKF